MDKTRDLFNRLPVLPLECQAGMESLFRFEHRSLGLLAAQPVAQSGSPLPDACRRKASPVSLRVAENQT